MEIRYMTTMLSLKRVLFPESQEPSLLTEGDGNTRGEETKKDGMIAAMWNQTRHPSERSSKDRPLERYKALLNTGGVLANLNENLLETCKRQVDSGGVLANLGLEKSGTAARRGKRQRQGRHVRERVRRKHIRKTMKVDFLSVLITRDVNGAVSPRRRKLKETMGNKNHCLDTLARITQKSNLEAPNLLGIKSHENRSSNKSCVPVGESSIEKANEARRGKRVRAEAFNPKEGLKVTAPRSDSPLVRQRQSSTCLAAIPVDSIVGRPTFSEDWSSMSSGNNFTKQIGKRRSKRMKQAVFDAKARSMEIKSSPQKQPLSQKNDRSPDDCAKSAGVDISTDSKLQMNSLRADSGNNSASHLDHGCENDNLLDLVDSASEIIATPEPSLLPGDTSTNKPFNAIFVPITCKETEVWERYQELSVKTRIFHGQQIKSSSSVDAGVDSETSTSKNEITTHDDSEDRANSVSKVFDCSKSHDNRNDKTFYTQHPINNNVDSCISDSILDACQRSDHKPISNDDSSGASTDVQSIIDIFDATGMGGMGKMFSDRDYSALSTRLRRSRRHSTRFVEESKDFCSKTVSSETSKTTRSVSSPKKSSDVHNSKVRRSKRLQMVQTIETPKSNESSQYSGVTTEKENCNEIIDLPKYLVRTKTRKKSKAGVFEGESVSYNRIKYEDDDTKDLEQNEVFEILMSETSSNMENTGRLPRSISTEKSSHNEEAEGIALPIGDRVETCLKAIVRAHFDNGQNVSTGDTEDVFFNSTPARGEVEKKAGTGDTEDDIFNATPMRALFRKNTGTGKLQNQRRCSPKRSRRQRVAPERYGVYVNSNQLETINLSSKKPVIQKRKPATDAAPKEKKRLKRSNEGLDNNGRFDQVPGDPDFQWSASQLLALYSAHRTVDPKSVLFWDDISEFVEEKSAMECREKWFSLVKTPISKKGRNAAKSASKESGHQRIHGLDDDDIFNATPIRGAYRAGKGNQNISDKSLDNISAIANGSAIKVSADSDEKNSCCSIRKIPNAGFPQGYKGYIQNIRRHMRQKEKKTKRGQKLNITNHLMSKKHICEKTDEGIVEMTCRLSPGGTLQVNTLCDSDLEDDLYDEDE